MNITTQRMCVWCGPLLALLFFLGFWVIAGFIPPPSPADAASVIAARFRDDATEIRWGLELCCFSGALCVPWAAAVSVQLKRIEGRYSPLTYAQLGLGAALPFEFIVPIYFWMTAAYRADRPASEIQLLNDLGWLPFTGLIYTIAIQAVVIGVAVLGDKRSVPLLPRWFGFFSIGCAVAFCPACLDVFSQSGPLAWNGLIAWWLLVVAFFLWLAGLSRVLLLAISRQAGEQAAAEPASNAAPDHDRAGRHSTGGLGSLPDGLPSGLPRSHQGRRSGGTGSKPSKKRRISSRVRGTKGEVEFLYTPWNGRAGPGPGLRSSRSCDHRRSFPSPAPVLILFRA
jgi:hypothetical protein